MMFPICVPSAQQIRIGDPIPNGALSIPPRIPYNLLSAGSLPAAFNAPPYPSNCFMNRFPNVHQIKNFNNNTPNSIHPNAQSPANIVLLPDIKHFPFNKEFDKKETNDKPPKQKHKS